MENGRDLADPIGPPRLFASLFPVEVSDQGGGGHVGPERIGGPEQASQADCSEIFGRRRSQVPPALVVEGHRSLDGLPPFEKLPRGDEVQVAVRSPDVRTRKRFGQHHEHLRIGQRQLEAGRVVQGILSAIREPVKCVQRRHGDERLLLGSPLLDPGHLVPRVLRTGAERSHRIAVAGSLRIRGGRIRLRPFGSGGQRQGRHRQGQRKQCRHVRLHCTHRSVAVARHPHGAHGSGMTSSLAATSRSY